MPMNIGDIVSDMTIHGDGNNVAYCSIKFDNTVKIANLGDIKDTFKIDNSNVQAIESKAKYICLIRPKTKEKIAADLENDLINFCKEQISDKTNPPSKLVFKDSIVDNVKFIKLPKISGIDTNSDFAKFLNIFGVDFNKVLAGLTNYTNVFSNYINDNLSSSLDNGILYVLDVKKDKLKDNNILTYSKLADEVKNYKINESTFNDQFLSIPTSPIVIDNDKPQLPNINNIVKAIFGTGYIMIHGYNEKIDVENWINGIELSESSIEAIAYPNTKNKMLTITISAKLGNKNGKIVFEIRDAHGQITPSEMKIGYKF